MVYKSALTYQDDCAFLYHFSYNSNIFVSRMLQFQVVFIRKHAKRSVDCFSYIILKKAVYNLLNIPFITKTLYMFLYTRVYDWYTDNLLSEFNTQFNYKWSYYVIANHIHGIMSMISLLFLIVICRPL